MKATLEALTPKGIEAITADISVLEIELDWYNGSGQLHEQDKCFTMSLGDNIELDVEIEANGSFHQTHKETYLSQGEFKSTISGPYINEFTLWYDGEKIDLTKKEAAILTQELKSKIIIS